MKNKETNKAKAKELLAGFLIDPYKQEILMIETVNNLDVWYKILQCDYVEYLCLSGPTKQSPLNLDIWFDEEGLLKDPVAPMFRMVRGKSAGSDPIEIAGYALIFASNSEGRTIGLNSDSFGKNMFAMLSQLSFEDQNVTKRFTETDLIGNQLRLIEQELPGQFRISPEDQSND